MKNGKPGDVPAVFSNYVEVLVDEGNSMVRLSFAESKGDEGTNWHTAVAITVESGRILQDMLEKLLPKKPAEPVKH